MGREDFSQSSQLSTLVGKPTNRYKRLPKNVTTLQNLTEAKTKPNNRYHYSIYPLVQREYQASYTQLTNLDFYSPIISIKGSVIVSHLIGTIYEDAGVKVDEGSTLISTVSTVDDTKFGTYSVTYTATDGINPNTTAVRTVKVGIPPDVTINGINPFNLEKFDVYVDSGVTINDSNSTLISTTSTVNNLTVGTYTVNYTVSNPAFTEVFSRTVRVDDTIPPVITIAGDNPYTLERFDVYTDPGAAVDLGSELTNTDLSNVQNTAIGSFDVVYTAYDGNTTVTATRTVNVVDTVPPVITILGDDPYTLERFDVYTDEGATVDTGSILTTDISAVNNALTHGSSFVVTYTATDGNTAHDVTQTRTVNIVDTKPPVITLLGDVDPYQIEPSISFQDVDPGFEVDLGTSVSVDYSNVVTTDNSNFDVVYRASDGVNPDAVVIRRVAVADTLSPIITITGNNPVTLERYSVYTDQGVTLDPGSSLASTVSTVDNTAVGSYTVTYVATDNINPDTTATRIVNVVDTTAPVVTLNGANPLTMERFAIFSDVDPGVSMDANGTLASVDISQLNNTTQGTYTVTYNVVDDHNNANVITREVVVEDTVPPVVTLNDESTFYTLERYGDWSAIDPGVTIDIGSYVDSVTVDNTSTGLKVVTYTVKDGTNTTQKNRVITVVDTVAPVGSINNPSYQLERFGVFNDPGVIGLDPGTYLAGTDTSNVDSTLSSGSTFDVIYDLGDGTNNTYLTRTVTVIDTTPPAITITDGNVTVERFSTYVDLGATVDIGSTLITTDLSNVDTSLSPGSTFDIVYIASDGIQINSNVRTVTIVDTTPPIGSINNPSYQLERFSTFVDPGVTGMDEGTYLYRTDTSNVNNTLSNGSTFDVIYTLTDGVSNAYLTRTVTVVDSTQPTGTIAPSSATVERYSVYTDPTPGVINLDSGSYIAGVDLSNVDTTLSNGSTFDVIYDLGDGTNNTYLTRTVTVIDTIAPAITLLGANPLTIERYSTYSEPGATADGGENITITSTLDTSAVGSYTVTYSATDDSNNNTTVTRVVQVVDTTPPVITLLGSNPLTVERYSIYSDPGATTDGGENITLTSTLNMSIVGSYTLTYSATDDNNNTTTATRLVQVVDTTGPVITLTGANPLTIERYSTYIDPGAIADGGENVLTSASVNTSAVGSYTVTYSATDDNNNTTTVARTVNVVDTTAPVITLIGDNPLTLDRYTTYVDPGAYTDGGETIYQTGTVNMFAVGEYTRTYTSVDDQGNQSQVTRTIYVIDDTPPLITLNGSNEIILERYSSYTEQGAYADNNETVTISGVVNVNVVGQYTISYSATDDQNNTAVVTRTIIVQDTTGPIITLYGSNQITIERYSTYNEPGAYADGGETVNVTGTVDINTVGQYTLTYTATDDQNNTSSKPRVIIVEDTTDPVITLNGSSTLTLERYTNYIEYGASADGGETVTITGSVNMNTVGSYTVTYSASDPSGNIGTATRTVTVIDTTPPVITLIGSDPYNVDVSTPYTDPGASTDGGETVTIDTSGLDMTLPDTYTVSYTATDSYNNTGTVTRSVRVYGWEHHSDIQASIEYFGKAVAITPDGNTIVIGAYRANTPPYSGRAYVYVRSNSNSAWSLDATLVASDVQYTDNNGYSVAISDDGNTVVTGAINENHFDTGYPSGSAYVFVRSGTTWTNQAILVSQERTSDPNWLSGRFGWSVSISGDGDTIAVGEPHARGSFYSLYTGVVSIFARSGTTWTNQARIQDPNYQYDLFLGFSVELSGNGNTIIVGAPTNGSNNGKVFICTRSGSNWSIQHTISSPSKWEYSRGVSISKNGSLIVIASRDDTYIYTYNGSSWSLQQTLSIGGNWCQLDDNGNKFVLGGNETAYIFTRSGSTWSQKQRFYTPSPDITYKFGEPVVISGGGETIAIGASSGGGFHTVRIYDRTYPPP
jgi:hypothetical protein